MSDPKDKDQANPNTLSQSASDAGIELNENQLDNVSGGLLTSKLSDKI
jgi:bacteriocin-like protein